MSKVEEKILELGLELPKISTPIASYIPAKKVINYLIIITYFYAKNMTIIKGLYL